MEAQIAYALKQAETGTPVAEVWVLSLSVGMREEQIELGEGRDDRPGGLLPHAPAHRRAGKPAHPHPRDRLRHGKPPQ